MRYDYQCRACGKDNKPFIFEVKHGMKEKPSVKCPRCGGVETEIAFTSQPMSYIRGYGWLDVKGRRNDMHKYHLQHNDPYKHMRKRGEKADLMDRLRKNSRFNKNPKTFSMSSKKK